MLAEEVRWHHWVLLHQIEPFSFDKLADWLRWIRRFDRFRVASQLNKQGDDAEVNMLMYCMGDEADDVLKSFTFAEDETMTYEMVDHVG